jgi:hypothetical protein
MLAQKNAFYYFPYLLFIITKRLWGKFDGLTALRPCPITPHLTPVLLIQDETQCNLILLQQCDNNIVTVEF